MTHRPKKHHYLILILEFINWGLFLAVWISISVNIGRHDQCVASNGGHSHSKPCDTIYTALAFAIADWLLFSFTFFSVGWALSTKNTHVHEKSTGAGGAAVRPSDDRTLEGDTAA
jgi:hypothetical protein